MKRLLSLAGLALALMVTCAEATIGTRFDKVLSFNTSASAPIKTQLTTAIFGYDISAAGSITGPIEILFYASPANAGPIYGVSTPIARTVVTSQMPSRYVSAIGIAVPPGNVVWVIATQPGCCGPLPLTSVTVGLDGL
jgi:hypothetical protein